MRKLYVVRGRARGLSDHFGPHRRLLDSRVGRCWDDVLREGRSRLDRDLPCTGLCWSMSRSSSSLGSEWWVEFLTRSRGGAVVIRLIAAGAIAGSSILNRSSFGLSRPGAQRLQVVAMVDCSVMRLRGGRRASSPIRAASTGSKGEPGIARASGNSTTDGSHGSTADGGSTGRAGVISRLLATYVGAPTTTQPGSGSISTRTRCFASRSSRRCLVCAECRLDLSLRSRSRMFGARSGAGERGKAALNSGRVTSSE